MGLCKKTIPIKIEWVDFEKVFKLFCNSRNLNGKIIGRELTKVEIENAIQISHEIPDANIEIPRIVGDFEIGQEDIEFSLHDEKLEIDYVHPLESQDLKDFIELLEENKEAPELLLYGVKKGLSHYNARELMKEDFFWSCIDHFAPFGSDQGDGALAEFREWREENPNEKMLFYVASYLSGGWEFRLQDYTSKMVLNKELIKEHELDEEYDTYYNYFVLDTCIIATCFGQFIDEGKIDEEVIPILEISIQKLILWNEIQKEDWEKAEEYTRKLNVLRDAVIEIKNQAAENRR